MFAPKRARVPFLTALAAIALAPAGFALDVVYPHNLCASPGETKELDMWARVSNPDGDVEWCISNDAGDDFDVGFGQSSATASPYSNGYFRIQVAFTAPVTATAGQQATYTIEIKVDDAVVATSTGRITIWGEHSGQHFAAVEPSESHAETPSAGSKRVISFKIQNDETDLLPHAYDFLSFADNQLAPGLDLYELTPISGFDLPTVIGAGTPLMSGKLEEILPFDDLLVEIEVQTIPGQEDGEGNQIWLEVTDDSSPATLASSSAVVISCSLDPEASTTERNGTGVNPTCLSGGNDPEIGTVWSPVFDTGLVPGAAFSALIIYDTPLPPIPTDWGELLVIGTLLFSSVEAATGGLDAHEIPIPNNACLGGAVVYSQGAVVGAETVLCNAVDVAVGF